MSLPPYLPTLPQPPHPTQLQPLFMVLKPNIFLVNTRQSYPLTSGPIISSHIVFGNYDYANIFEIPNLGVEIDNWTYRIVESRLSILDDEIRKMTEDCGSLF